jgi:Periplasmic copper-binding protein (NosD)
MIVAFVIAACIDPVSFGAIPNDGKSDTDAIQRAIDKAEETHGAVCLGPGVWNLTRSRKIPSLLIDRGPIEMYGVGPTTILRMSGPGGHGDWRAVQVRGPATGVVVRDLTIDGLDARDTEEQTHLLEIAFGAKSTQIRNVTLGPMRRPDQKVGDGIGGDCIRLIGEQNQDVAGVEIIGSTLVDCDRSGVAIQRHVRDVVISQDAITGAGDTPIDFEPTGSDPGGAIHRITISQTTLDRTTDAQGDFAITLTGSDLTVTDVAMHNGGINLGNVSRVAITNSVIDGRGARLSIYRRAELVTITGNRITPASNAATLPVIRASHNHGFIPHGIVISHNVIFQPRPAPTIELLSAHHATIEDNEIHYTASDPTWAFIDVEAVADDIDQIKIVNNQLHGDGLGLRLGPGRHAFHDIVFAKNVLRGSHRAVRCEGQPQAFRKPLALANNAVGGAAIECDPAIVSTKP